MDISNLARDGAKKINRHTPLALAIIGSAGVIATGYLAYRAGVKATTRIAHEEKTNEAYENTPMTTEQKIKLTWSYYIAPLSMGIATVACVVTGNVISTKRQTALIGAYALGERAFSQYKDKMIETLGLDTEKDIVQNLAQEKASSDAAAVYNEADIPLIDGKKAMFIDSFSGQRFICQLEEVYKAQEMTNKRVAETGYASMNYFYSMVGATRTELYEVIGWNTDRLMDLIISRVNHEDEDTIPIYGIDFMERPLMEHQRVV